MRPHSASLASEASFIEANIDNVVYFINLGLTKLTSASGRHPCVCAVYSGLPLTPLTPPGRPSWKPVYMALKICKKLGGPRYIERVGFQGLLDNDSILAYFSYEGFLKLN